ncbi:MULTISPECIES: L-lactate MFS transporter [unclassified Tolypothrix]|uniref:L-lactate MFS transporter n=1 Tax=unclassified Tolypothrix TaxID=2649714 RepID=UPI0005EABEF9|nr:MULTISPECIES: OFA family MFS transporter [unclassified Tolypothrix]BAY94420.1 major facilitator superfamily transporter [Microchaete diplosiphon NIES-3275]EKF02879.1 transporter, major facilitator family protein [Tolypothrix sp. PCC 7601]MBE9086847.1 OFA family MFS transporter [Tolypothrix sp. LEGE 11397]UYD28137.1 OFA family MFS transporter [Tolypothrix sp. PCC 7712]UYD35990.1 OFA family MFS transporter [Tolypothrix sp. PCC 7601]
MNINQNFDNSSFNEIKLFGLPAEKGRWLLIPLGVLVLLCLGTAYSWSIFRNTIEKSLAVGATESLLPFTILLVVFSILMPITGFYIEKIGPRLVTAVGAIVMGIGYAASGLVNNIPLLTITYGIIAGAGVGIVYGVPLAVNAKWFPDKKGLAVGATVIGFGLSPLVTAPLAKNLIAANGDKGWQPTLIIFGIVFTLIILAIAPVMKYPPNGWQPAGWTPPIKLSESASNSSTPLLKSLSFYGLWLCFTIGTFAGLAAIGIASPVGTEIIGLDKNTAASAVSLFAVFNGLGRPLFGWLADKYKPKNAAIISYVLIIVASIMMLSATKGAIATYLVAFSLIYLALGGWLAIGPTSTLILFRSQDYAKNYGVVFTAFGMGALLGTLIVGNIRDIFGNYLPFFNVTIGLSVIGIILAVFLLKRKDYKISI